MSVLIPRNALARLIRLSPAFRVVIVNGPRQAGKTTLVRLLQEATGGSFRSLDDDATLAAAIADPREFVTYGETPRVIDEVQRGGDALVLAVKHTVDRDNARGQFVLSGSSRFLTVPTLSESLAGRAAFVDVWPFAMVERTGVTDDLAALLVNDPEALFGEATSPWMRSDYLRLVCQGGFPEAVAMDDAELRREWFRGYLRTVIQRDVRQFADIQHSAAIPRLLRLVAARTGSAAVVSDLAQSLAMDQKTIRNYLSYLDVVFLSIEVPAWSTNLSSKVAKSGRIYLADTGLAAQVMGVGPSTLALPGNAALGPLVETFVATELTKLLANHSEDLALHHFRDRDGREIDFIIEAPDGRLVGIEVKASSSVTASDFRHLRWLAEKAGDRLTAGIVLYLGEHALPFGDRMIAAPVSALWRHATLSDE